MLYAIIAAVALAVPLSNKSDRFFSQLLTVSAALAFVVIVVCAIGIYRDADMVNRCTGAI
jgi:hypothetical protein